MVPVIVAVKVDAPSGEVIVIVVCVVPDPEALANRPVPPLIVNVTVSWKTSGLADTGQDVP